MQEMPVGLTRLVQHVTPVENQRHHGRMVLARLSELDQRRLPFGQMKILARIVMLLPACLVRAFDLFRLVPLNNATAATVLFQPNFHTAALACDRPQLRH